VRGEILLAANAAGYRSNAIRTPGRSEAQELDLLVPNVEMATGCSPEFLPGMPPSKKAQELVARIYGLLHSSRVLESEQLRIYGAVVGEDEDENEDENGDVEEKVEVKAFWTLYIDILFISLDGNPFDAAWAAVIAALRDTKLPGTKWDQDRGMVVASNAVANAQLLKLRGPPFACSFAVFKAKESARTRGPDDKSWVLVDPDAFEEGLCDEKVTLVIDRSENKTRVVSIEKAGGVAIGREEMKSLVKSAEKRWTEWNDLLQR
jgi:exosome complex component RRP43